MPPLSAKKLEMPPLTPEEEQIIQKNYINERSLCDMSRSISLNNPTVTGLARSPVGIYASESDPNVYFAVWLQAQGEQDESSVHQRALIVGEATKKGDTFEVG